MVRTQQLNDFTNKSYTENFLPKGHPNLFSSLWLLNSPWHTELTWQHPAQLAERSRHNTQ
jgi:hypothetical protein